MECLRRKVVEIEIEVTSLKNSPFKKKDKTEPLDTNLKLKTCNVCNEKFEKNCDLERHVMDKHEEEKRFRCDVCDKQFVLEWRMKKHSKVHTEKSKMCNYHISNKFCPYEDIGCKFSHVEFEQEATEEDLESDIDAQVDDCPSRENQCHLCKLQLLDKDALFHHVERAHEAYFQGMLEVATNLKNFQL